MNQLPLEGFGVESVIPDSEPTYNTISITEQSYDEKYKLFEYLSKFSEGKQEVYNKISIMTNTPIDEVEKLFSEIAENYSNTNRLRIAYKIAGKM